MQAELAELAYYQLEKAEECLSDAQAAWQEERFANTANRSYYAMFHSVRALLALDGFDSKKHSTIIGYFNQHYVAAGKVDPQCYQMLANAFRIRNKSDYDDFYVIGREETEIQLQHAVVLLNVIREYIEEQFIG